KGSRRLPSWSLATSTLASELLHHRQSRLGLGLRRRHITLRASGLGFLHEVEGLAACRLRPGERAGRLHILTTRGLHILTTRSLHILSPRRLNILTPRSLHVLTPRSLPILSTRRLGVLATRSLNILTTRSLHVLTARGFGLHARTS